MSKPVSCVRGRKHAVSCHRHVCVHRRRQEFLWMNAEPVWHKNILWLHIQRDWQRYFVRTVSRVKHRISMKGEAAFWKQALPCWTWEAALQVTAKTEPSTTSASERETGGLAACVCVSQLVCLFYFLVCFLSVLRGGVMERGVLSVLYTKKIKLLMAWVSSNGTLSWVCVLCVCVHQQSCIQSISYSWLHYSIQAWAFSLFSICSSLSLSLHVGILRLLFPGCRAAPVSPLRTNERSTLLLWRPCTSSHIYHTKSLLWRWTQPHLSADVGAFYMQENLLLTEVTKLLFFSFCTVMDTFTVSTIQLSSNVAGLFTQIMIKVVLHCSYLNSI